MFATGRNILWKNILVLKNCQRYYFYCKIQKYRNCFCYIDLELLKNISKWKSRFQQFFRIEILLKIGSFGEKSLAANISFQMYAPIQCTSLSFLSLSPIPQVKHNYDPPDFYELIKPLSIHLAAWYCRTASSKHVKITETNETISIWLVIKIIANFRAWSSIPTQGGNIPLSKRPKINLR